MKDIREGAGGCTVPAILLEGVKKRFGAVEALRGVSFTVPSGSIVGLLGPNGAGKTTTLKIIAGLLRRDAGRVSVLGLDPQEDPVGVRELVGILHERPVYPPRVSVRRLLRYAAAARGFGEEEVERVIRLVGLERYRDAKVSSLSRGYVQRLGIAQALIGGPRILLLDEPTANLDPPSRFEILDMIKLLHEELGVTTVVSSHIIPELERVCDYAIFIGAGRVLAEGRVTELAVKFGCTLTYRVRVGVPRRFAAEAVSLDYVVGVEVRDGEVLVSVASGRGYDFEAWVEGVKSELGVASFEPVTARLDEVYRRVMGSGQAWP